MFFYYILVLSLPLTQHWLLGASVAGFTLEKALGLVCLPFAAAHVLGGGRLPQFSRAAAGCCVAYFAVALVLNTAATEPSWASLLLQNNILSIFIFLVVTVLMVDSVSRLRTTVLVMIGSVALASIYAIREWLEWGHAVMGYRPGSISGDANYFGACAAASLPLTYVLLRAHPAGKQKLFLIGSFFISLLAFTLAASRGAFIGAAAGFLIVVYRSRKRVRNLVLAGLLVVPVLLLAPNSPVQRLFNPQYGDQMAITARQVAWKAGLRMIADHPLIGVGTGRFKVLMPNYVDRSDNVEVVSVAHNTYIEVAAEQGLIGFSLFIASLIAGIVALGRLANVTISVEPPWLSPLCIGLQAALVAMCVSAFFISAWWFRFFWLPMFLGISMQAIVKTVVDEEPTAFAAEA